MNLERARVAAFPIAAVVAVGFVLRLILYARFHGGAFSPVALTWALFAGVGYDVLVTLVVTAPLILGLAAFRLRVLALASVRFLVLGAIGGFIMFGAFVEYFFFDEFDARYNHIALDYVRHPREVLGNIVASYDVPLVAAIATVSGALLGLAALRLTRGATFRPRPWRARWQGTLVAACVVFGAGVFLEVAPAEVSSDRVVSEVAHNGLDRLVHAFRTGNLDYDRYYPVLPPALAHARAAAYLGFPPDLRVSRAGDPRPWDVVVILEESFGSEFVGVLGHAERKTTPGFDRWSRQGTLLTNLTATGNRTVRGLEGTLCSFVPLPGGALLRRKKHERVATLAEVFRGNGYETTFLYGGWGTFDDMKPFFPNNGFDEFVERDSFPKDAFSTIWGVADEYIFAELLDRQRAARASGKRLFATLMSVSNHKPFDVPERGTAYPASERRRESAVAYADWALADYLDRAKAEGFLDHTVVVIEGDHGARVYGAEEIPVASYRIPGLFLVPDPAWRGKRIERLASQIDLAPTILALVGIPTSAPFLGENLADLPVDGGRAFVQHDREVGILSDDALITLGLDRRVHCYRRSDRESDAFTHAECEADARLRALVHDATAVYQTAYDMLQAGEFVLPVGEQTGIHIAKRHGGMRREQ